MTTAMSDPLRHAPGAQSRLLPDSGLDLARRYAWAGALWAVVALSLAVLYLVTVATAHGLPMAVGGPGRLDAAYRHVALWGMMSLPLAGALLWLSGLSQERGRVVRLAGLAFWCWQLALIGGLVAILALGAGAEPWSAAPALAQAGLWLAVVLWAAAIWSCHAASADRLTVAGALSLAAAVALVAVQTDRLLAELLTGASQAVAMSLASRGMHDLWVVLAGFALSAAVLPSAADRPLFGRRVALVGGVGWLVLAAVALGRDLPPDLYGPTLARLTTAAAALTLAAAVFMGVALLGTLIGADERWREHVPAVLATWGVVGILAGAMVAAGNVAAPLTTVQFTAWRPLHVVVPPLPAAMLLAAAAAHAVNTGAGGQRSVGLARRHLWLVLGAAALSVAVLWPLGLAEMAAPDGVPPALEAGLRLPGAVLGWLAAVVWALLTWRWSRSGGDPLAERPVPDLRGSLSFTPAAVVGATVGVLVLAFFVTLFMPLADPTALEGTTRTAGRELEPGTLAASGRSQYIADGCVTCHTQRVRAVAGDERYGPPSLRGDYGDGPALAGERRMGPDLMWVGDRYGSPAAMAAAMAVHAAGGPVALPWLLGPTGPTVDGAAVTDYLLRLTSTAESGP